ncbi:hypothetical protein GCM10020358_44440 [Amorphoplanes nipponensis]|uniref:PH domain-containing protein n=1 Tax=Actinoplanes nipponensis TaxID=135950 RepID=A0A919JE39_9ACTN|nr:hypothetical protein [Actinoplanes nipponensis]GIE49033.1 hypothetical protein Ani05nite_25670 [Actinoplanes nipponensis]
MAAEPAGRDPRITFGSGGDRLILKIVFLITLVGFTVELGRPSVASWCSDAAFALFMASACWFAFRAGFRTRLVAHARSFAVVNLLSVHDVPYGRVDGIVLDWLSIRLVLASGRRIRVWGLPESFLAARGDRARELVRRLSDLVEQRRQPGEQAAEHRRVIFADWWVFVAVLATFSAAIVHRTVNG